MDTVVKYVLLSAPSLQLLISHRLKGRQPHRASLPRRPGKGQWQWGSCPHATAHNRAALLSATPAARGVAARAGTRPPARQALQRAALLLPDPVQLHGGETQVPSGHFPCSPVRAGRAGAFQIRPFFLALLDLYTDTRSPRTILPCSTLLRQPPAASQAAVAVVSPLQFLYVGSQARRVSAMAMRSV
ncbi:hypothetical protein CALCODRAFT_26183 [Calocera cornea HHB12733]|uniref:Uncharacterized protein n=1 Tax=Calocera cornea HHB12733 TaxID=1353952 RepID=A0A165J392_9BASI|nr:hypothetical protein CALCODRAFT_26183 [Calocera cornea HHB12733]